MSGTPPGRPQTLNISSRYIVITSRAECHALTHAHAGARAQVSMNNSAVLTITVCFIASQLLDINLETYIQGKIEMNILSKTVQFQRLAIKPKGTKTQIYLET